MKPIFEQLVPNMIANSRVQGSNFGCQWHFHPEMELTLVLQGGTQRWVGDKITALKPGDLTFLGADLPHDFRNDAVPGSTPKDVDAVNIHFHPDFLGHDWLNWPDMVNIQTLFKEAKHGLEVSGATRDRVAERMINMLETSGTSRLILLLELLNDLSTSEELTRIASPGYFTELHSSDKDRMGMISSFIHEHMCEPLYVKDVAKHVSMSEGAFSRYFRNLTRKTFPAYLNELRIARVCRLLAETDATVTEIALSCGFDSMANFETQFHRHQQCSPKIYRQRALSIAPKVQS